MTKHECYIEEKGDWQIIKCRECDYELWDNMKTGVVEVINSSREYDHSMVHTDPEYVEKLQGFNEWCREN